MFVSAVYSIFIWKNQPICRVIENIEKTVNESKHNVEALCSNRWPRKNIFFVLGSKNPASKANYMDVNLKVEKWTKIIHFALMRVVLYGVIFPKFIFCFYLFYTTDLGPDAFELPFPVW